MSWLFYYGGMVRKRWMHDHFLSIQASAWLLLCIVPRVSSCLHDSWLFNLYVCCLQTQSTPMGTCCCMYQSRRLASFAWWWSFQLRMTFLQTNAQKIHHRFHVVHSLWCNGSSIQLPSSSFSFCRTHPANVYWDPVDLSFESRLNSVDIRYK